ncbi:3'-5' exonuclease [Mycolicibacterium mucogenicum]|uniref:3'-5' exonuclease n=1 Tax=Mycolicibacterium mucogenicum TaxID=56689 RepID=UPI0013F4D1DE|nr:3'-5' exonuclease [Mycolicibacterium mucogenicum]
MSLLGGADRIAVIDVETTGLYNVDRVVELAIVTMDSTGTVVDEFETLINPHRDPGPTWIHGLTPTMLAGAPGFDDIAAHVAARLHGAVVVGHNLRFDTRMIGNEFGRANIGIDWGTGLDTLRATGCKLEVACAEYGIVPDGAHRALFDARATGRLLFAVADAFSRACLPVVAKPLRHSPPRRVLTRDGVIEIDVGAPYLASLARGVHADVDVASYAILLDRAVADLQLTAEERHELTALATELGLDDHGRKRAHREFLDGLIDAALEDGVVTEVEQEQLCRAAALLELDVNVVTRRTNAYRLTPESIGLDAGLIVCFTGTVLDDFGNQIDRESVLECEARQHGLVPIDRFRKDCGLVIAADTASESKKVREARRLGVPVASVADYRAALCAGRPVMGTRAVPNGVAQVCIECGASWMAVRRSSKPLCTSCRGGTTQGSRGADAPITTSRVKPVVAQQPPAIQTLECSQCNCTWERPRSRGRRPLRCPGCLDAEKSTSGAP